MPLPAFVFGPHLVAFIGVDQSVPRGHGLLAHHAGEQEDLVGLGLLEAVLALDERRLGLDLHLVQDVGLGAPAIKPAWAAIASCRSMISTSASIRSACNSSKVFTAGPSATIVLEKFALEASPESMYSGMAKAAAAGPQLGLDRRHVLVDRGRLAGKLVLAWRRWCR